MKNLLVFLFLLAFQTSFSQIKIMMKKEGGIYMIPCKVNGLPLDFIFDTGASDVSISATETLFMLKNNYLKREDLGETVYSQIADGSVVEGQKILIREIEIAGLKLTNVEASYSKTLSAPLLLGQSAIEKLGPIQLNGNELIILNKGVKVYDFYSEKKTANNLSYAFGMLIGTDLKTRGLTAKDVNAEELAKGLKAAMGEGAPEMDMQAAQALVQQEFTKIQQAAQSKSIEEGKKFLEANAKRKEVKTTASGLQYEVLKDASGAKPSLQDKVKVHYHGTLTNGTVFDSSVDRGEPISFPLNGVIQGWQEGLQLMPVGSKYKLYIPSNLGYGSNPAGKIPANSVLIFEVELIGINQ